MTTKQLGIRGVVCLFTALITTGCAQSTWPQWGGPDRNFIVASGRLANAWPAEGPKRLWSRPLGDGYSTIVSDGATLFTMYRKDKEDPSERVIALDAATGATKWEHAYAAPYICLDPDDEDKKQTTQFGAGPNGTPVLVGGRLFTIGFTGKMCCLDAATGKEQWSHDLFKEYGATMLVCGYASSPIAYRDTIIALVGGKGHGLMAFDQATGRVVWKSGDMDCSYSSPVMASVDGEDHLVAYMAGEIIGASPKTGEIQWSLVHRNPTNANCICTPIACPNNCIYFVNGGDAAGGKMVRLEKKGGKIQPSEVWCNTKLSGGITDVVRIGDYFYGGNGRGFFVGFHAKTGQIVWQERGYPSARAVAADGKLIVLDQDGRLTLVTATPGGLVQHGRTTLLEKEAWSAPTLIGTKLYLRDRKMIMGVELG
jgi:outer membrane protein assembly factor BamB